VPTLSFRIASLEVLQTQPGLRCLAVLAVASRNNARDLRSFVDEHRLSSPALLDPGAHAYGVYEIWSLPTSFVIDKRRYLVGKVVGHRDWSSAQSKIVFCISWEAQLTSLDPNRLLVSALMPSRCLLAKQPDNL